MRHYSYSDTSAPILTMDDTSFRNILTKVLVDGYGSKNGAGWQIKHQYDRQTIYEMPDNTWIHVYESNTEICVRGCTDSLITDYDFPDRHTYHFFPSIYQNDNGFIIDKNDISGRWEMFTSHDFFYLISGKVVLFFGKWNDYDRFKNQAIICSTSFGLMLDETEDHSIAFNLHGMFYPTMVGKKLFFLDSKGPQFSSVHLYHHLSQCTLGTMPGLYAGLPEYPFNPGYMVSSMGKKLFCSVINGNYLFFDVNE